MTPEQHPDDTHPDIDPGGALPDQLTVLGDWIDARLDDEWADRQCALERALDYVRWLAYRAEQVSQQLDIDLTPTEETAPIFNLMRYVPVPEFPNRDRRQGR